MATRKSKSGQYRVQLSAKFEDADFVYRPSHDAITVDQDLYDRMDAAGVIEHADPV